MTGPAASDDNSAQTTPGALVREVEIVNKKGLHARASAKFVQVAEQYDANIKVTRGHESVGGTSIMGLMMLAAGPGSSITVTAKGYEARECLDALEDLLSDKFGEGE
jgi:phosphocarrier protein HPr